MSTDPLHWPKCLHSKNPPYKILATRPIVNEMNWLLRPAFTDGRNTSTVLFAGPWVGEFGWELLNWHAWIRKLAPQYREVIVCARKSSEALYEDFATRFISHDIRGTANGHVAFDMDKPEKLQELLKSIPAGADHLVPRRYIPQYEQDFIPLGRARSEYACDVLIHARGRSFTPERNWGLDLWTELCEKFSAQGIQVGAIGLSSDTITIPKVEDYRDRPLRETLDRMASSRLVIGPSSGPMHMASLCKTPHVVWTDKQTYSMRKTSREKYEQWWNPLQTPVRVLDDAGFQPKVADVLGVVEKMLEG